MFGGSSRGRSARMSSNNGKNKGPLSFLPIQLQQHVANGYLPLGCLAAVLIFIVLWYFSGGENNQADISQILAAHNVRKHSTSCMFVHDHGSGTIDELLADQNTVNKMLLYDNYLYRYCDIQFFIFGGFDVSKGNDYFVQKLHSLKSADGRAFITQLRHTYETEFFFFSSEDYKLLAHWQRRKALDTFVWNFAFSNSFYKRYNWLLFTSKLDVLLLVDNFGELLRTNPKYATDNIMDRREPMMMGHYLEKHQAEDNTECKIATIPYYYGLTTYAINNRMLEAIVGPVAYQLHHSPDKVVCQNSQGCDFHTEDDFSSYCLTDWFGQGGELTEQQLFHKKMIGNEGVYDNKAISAIEPVRDWNGRDYFLIFQVGDHFDKMTEYKNDWYWNGKRDTSTGVNCCSDYPIVFANYNKYEELEFMYSYLYRETTLRTLSNIVEAHRLAH